MGQMMRNFTKNRSAFITGIAILILLGVTCMRAAAGGCWYGLGESPGTEAHGEINSALLRCCGKDRLDNARLLLKKGANVNAGDRQGLTPLMWAACDGSISLVDLLLSNGAEVGAKSKDGRTALMFASCEGHGHVMERLLEKGSDIEAKDLEGMTSLMWAAQEGQMWALSLMIVKKADLKARRNDGCSPVMVAASKGHARIIRRLIEEGVDLETMSNKGATALMIGAANGHGDVIELLLDKGANVNARDSDGKTALVAAVLYSGKLDPIKLMLNRGADIRIKDNQGKGPIEYAAESKNDPVHELLVEHAAKLLDPKVEQLLSAIKGTSKADVERLLNEGVDPNCEDAEGRTALIWASAIDPRWHAAYVDIVRLLLDRGAQTDKKGRKGETPLMQASSMGNLDVVGLLLDKGADVNATTQDGKTPLIAALCLRAHLGVAMHLVDKGANPNVRDRTVEERTALMVAVETGYAPLVRCLLDKGAEVNATDAKGQNVLAYTRDPEMARLLIESGANPNHRNKRGETALFWASERILYGTTGLAFLELLIENGADVNARDDQGMNVLSHVIMTNQMTSAMLLIKNGTKVNATDNNGRTPLMWACSRPDRQPGSRSSVRLIQDLLEAGADINAKDKYGCTPLLYAIDHYHYEAKKLLLEKGASE